MATERHNSTKANRSSPAPVVVSRHSKNVVYSAEASEGGCVRAEVYGLEVAWGRRRLLYLESNKNLCNNNSSLSVATDLFNAAKRESNKSESSP